MAADGRTGQILKIDLTSRKTSEIDSGKYVSWGGGHGMGSAVFWDLCEDKTVDGRDPKNVVTIMTSPFSGTMVPSASGRVEVQGIGIAQYPVGWFTRSNFGGRFGGMLKYAGWDGIAIVGKADAPVWIDIVDGDVQIRDAKGLWGKDTQDTQKAIWELKDTESHGWTSTGALRDSGRTTQKPAILTIGPAGEAGLPIGCLVHDAGNAAGQGGFGGIWGSKNLKAISVVGTGSIDIANPAMLINERLNSKETYAAKPGEHRGPAGLAGFSASPAPGTLWKVNPPGGAGPQSCQGCINGCRARWENGVANESHCQETSVNARYDALLNGRITEATYQVTDYLQRTGTNSYEYAGLVNYLSALFQMGVAGKGLAIDTEIDLSRIGTFEFAKELIGAMCKGTDIGADLADGTMRAAKKWGRLEEDLKTGVLGFPYWGMKEHSYDPRLEIEWGYGSILGDRDINEHCFNWNFWDSLIALGSGKEPPASAEFFVKAATDKMEPYAGDMKMLDYSTENMYSESIAKMVAWHRHYTRFWKESALLCDWRYPDFVNYHTEDQIGGSGDMEPKYWKAVTGTDMSFADGVELGRKIWNLDNAIWTLQGRHRDMVKFAPYIYETNADSWALGEFYPLPAEVDGEWKYVNVTGRKIDEAKFEEWKTLFYKLEGWDTKSGWPTRSTLEELGLDDIADALKSAGKLGA